MRYYVINYYTKGSKKVYTHYERTGSGSPIVYLHGWGCNGSIFRPVTERLPDFTNYSIDFAGFGQSDSPPESGWTVFDYANELIEFLDGQGLFAVTVVAHSFGCRVAAIVAVLRPELVSGLLLVAPAGLRKFSLKRWFKVCKYKLGKLFSKSEDCAHASDDYRNCAKNMRSTFVKVVNQDLSAYVRRITCPTLIVASKDDEAVPIKDARRYARLVRSSELAEIDGDHFAFFYAPKAFAETVSLFVNRG